MVYSLSCYLSKNNSFLPWYNIFPLSNKIIIEYKNLDYDDEDLEINRKTLKINYASCSSCKVIKKSSTIEKKLKIVLDKFISQKSSENKF